MGASTETNDPHTFPGEWQVRYRYPVGEVGARFFDALKHKRIVATSCSASGMTYLPPRAYCERSFEKCDGYVDAGSEGTIESATIVSAAAQSVMGGEPGRVIRAANALAARIAAYHRGPGSWTGSTPVPAG